MGILPVFDTRTCPVCGDWFHVYKHNKKTRYCSDKKCKDLGKGFAAKPKKKPIHNEAIDPLDVDSPYLSYREHWQAELLARVEMVKEGKI